MVEISNRIGTLRSLIQEIYPEMTKEDVDKIIEKTEEIWENKIKNNEVN